MKGKKTCCFLCSINSVRNEWVKCCLCVFTHVRSGLFFFLSPSCLSEDTDRVTTVLSTRALTEKSCAGIGQGTSDWLKLGWWINQHCQVCVTTKAERKSRFAIHCGMKVQCEWSPTLTVPWILRSRTGLNETKSVISDFKKSQLATLLVVPPRGATAWRLSTTTPRTTGTPLGYPVAHGACELAKYGTVLALPSNNFCKN